MRKWLLLAASTLVLAGCGQTDTATVESVEPVSSVAESVAVEEGTLVNATIKVTVDGEAIDDGEQEVEVEEGALLLDVMEEYYEIEETDTFISSINGHEQDADANKWWLFDVNGEMGELGAADLEVKEGDLIEWKLEAFE